MDDKENIIFQDQDKTGQEAGVMFSPVMVGPELPQESPPDQRKELSSDLNSQALKLNLSLVTLSALALVAIIC